MDGLDAFNKFLRQVCYKSRYLYLLENFEYLYKHSYISTPYFIRNAFTWETSLEKYDFWKYLDKQWQIIAKQYCEEKYTTEDIIERLSDYSYNYDELWTY